MAASIAKQATTTTKKTRQPTHKQAVIIKTKTEHPELTTREIAAIAETDHTHVIKTLQRYGIDRVRLDQFKNHKADVLAGMQERILASITDKDIEKAPMGSRILAAAQLIDKERIERGLGDASSKPLVVIQIKGDRTQIAVDSSVDKP